MAEDKYGLYILAATAVISIIAMLFTAFPINLGSLATNNGVGMTIGDNSGQYISHIITQGEGDYYFKMNWYNSAAQVTMTLDNSNTSLGVFYGYYPSMPPEVFLGHFTAGQELVFRHLNGWHGNVYGPFYSTDPTNYFITYNSGNTWTVTFDDGLHIGGLDGQFTVYTKNNINATSPVCGNGIIEGNEICDPGYAPTAVKNCTAFDPTWQGAASCKNTCDGYNTDTCARPTNITNSFCGNNIVDSGEQCDGNNIPVGCNSFGFLNGTMKCASNCTYDISQCNMKADCRDTDGGINGSVYGYVYIANGYPGQKWVDQCSQTYTGYVDEAYCFEDGTGWGYTTVYCQNGCSNGACNVAPIVNTTNTTIGVCTDSDGGLNYYVRGTYTYAYNGQTTVQNDSCQIYASDANGYITVPSCTGSNCYIYELYCESPSAGRWNMTTCPNGCNNGACIASANITNTTNQSSSAVLKDFPQPFLNKGGQVNTIFVVGRRAAVDDVIGITDIVASLQRYAGNNPFPAGIVKFDDEITTADYSKNIIVVGGPCANSVAAEIYGNPLDCTVEDTPGVGKIEWIPDKNKLLVHGYNSADTTMATRVLANWNDYNNIFKDSTAVCVTGTLDNMNVYKC